MSNHVSVKLNKMLTDNDKVIIIFADKNNIISEFGKEKYSATITEGALNFIEEKDLRLFKSFTIDSNKFNKEIRKYLFGISSFPIMIIFEKGKPKFIIPLSFY